MKHPQTEQMARLAFRVEGDFWRAYLAAPDTMKGAQEIASISLAAALNPTHKLAFMELMRTIVGDIIEAATGHRPLWPAPGGEPAPESERSGHA